MKVQSDWFKDFSDLHTFEVYPNWLCVLNNITFKVGTFEYLRSVKFDTNTKSLQITLDNDFVYEISVN